MSAMAACPAHRPLLRPREPGLPGTRGRQARGPRDPAAARPGRPLAALHAGRRRGVPRHRGRPLARDALHRPGATRWPSSPTARPSSGWATSARSARMPVMEGKAVLFKHFAGVDAVPVVHGVRARSTSSSRPSPGIAPTYGGINLEDISAPRCFEIEERLQERLDIPVFHDDQHGTAIVVLAGLLNAARVRRPAASRSCGSSSPVPARPASP